MFGGSAAAQTVGGTVTDDTGETLIGVAILRVGTTDGTVTDIDGTYSLTADPTDSLEFTYVGYAAQRVAVGGRSTVDVTMTTDATQLTEVVLTGYRSEQKRTTTGAISTVDFTDVETLPVQGLDQALQGRAAGVQVTNSTGAPGDAVSVRIRGSSTIGYNDPLYVVDGVPIQGGLNQIAPGDIATVTVLKDAAASIYGARAANGVVLITTKRGQSDVPQVSIETYVGLQRVGDLPKLLNTSQFIELQNEAVANTNVQRAARGQAALPLNPDNAANLPNVNWLDQIFRTAPVQSYRLGVSGATGKVDYLLSGNYYDQRGIILNSGFDRYTFRINTGISLRQNLRVGTNFTASRTGQDVVGSSGDGLGGNGGGVVRYALLRPSAIPLRNDDGSLSDLPSSVQFYGDAYNPVALLENTDWRRANERLLGNVFAEWTVVKGLQLRTSLGLDRSRRDEKRFNATFGDFDRINALNSLNVTEAREAIITWTSTATYNQRFGDAIEFDGLLGVETIDRQGQSLYGARSGFANQDPNFRYLGVGTEQFFADESAYASGLFSLFGQAKVGLRDRYFVTATLRRDGSSRFGSNNRFGYFPSVAVAWSILDEPALEQLRTGDLVSALKLRGSYGILGNQEIGDYGFASLVGQGRGYTFGNTVARSLAIARLGNPDLRWETNTQANVGLDLGLFSGAIQLSANAFETTTDDILVAVPVPYTGGAADAPVINAGSVRNRGLELEASYRHAGSFAWSLGGNVSFLHNEVVALGSDQPILAGATGGQVSFLTRTEPGFPIGSFYVYEADGIFQTQAEIDAHVGRTADGSTRVLQPDAVPGDIRFVDRNGDGVIDPDDRFHAGKPQPSVIYGLNADLSWRGFDLNMFWQGVAGNDIYHFQRRISEDASRPFNAYATLLDRWTGPGTSNTVPRVTRVDYNDNLRNSTRFLERGDYLRFKVLTVGYRFAPQAIPRVSALRLYVSAFNLLTFTKYSGLNPELGTNDNDRTSGDLAVGIDWGTYPVSRTFTFGINATL